MVWAVLHGKIARVEPTPPHRRASHPPRVALRCAQEGLREEKRRVPDPRMAVYLLAAEHSKPGMFYLGFIAHSNPHREYFTVTPDGFHFRQRVRGQGGRCVGAGSGARRGVQG